MFKKLLNGLSKKAIYLGIAGLIGAFVGSVIGEIPFLVTKKAEIQLSENILETQKRVNEAGGKTGNIQISLKWDNINDLDLHVFDPSNEEIYFSHKKSRSNGELDVDKNVNGETTTPVENVVWVNNPLEGNYKVYVEFYKEHSFFSNNNFSVVVNNGGVIQEFMGDINTVKDKQLIHQFTYLPTKIKDKENMLSILIVGLWSILVSLFIVWSLVIGQRKFLKQSLFSKKDIMIASVGGSIAGLVSGVVANYLFVMALPLSVAWAFMGLLLSISLTKVVPNLKLKSSIIGGLLGGLLGGIFFILLSDIFGEVFGRITGAMMIGFFIGIMISIFEEIYREAYLIIEWNAKERSDVTLGQKPIIIGSSKEADIYFNNVPSILATITFNQGEIKYNDKINNKSTLLSNNQEFSVRGVNMKVKIK